MVMKTGLFTLVFAIFVTLNVNGQNKKNVVENNIHKVTVYEDKADKAGGESIESVTIFNEDGEITEEIEYNSEGEIKKHIKYTFDDENRKIKETHLDAKGKTEKVYEFKYSGSLKTERTEYDDKGKIVCKKRYVYEMKK